MTERVVFDTNVLISANGQADQADSQCELCCIEVIEKAIKDKQIVLLDDKDLIMGEYFKHCQFSGAPGVGNKFFKFLHDNQFSENSVLRVSVQPVADEDRGFANLPPNNFDKSDQKFLSVAKEGQGRVLNAIDSDWREHADFVASLDVAVTELCPQCLK